MTYWEGGRRCCDPVLAALELEDDANAA